MSLTATPVTAAGNGYYFALANDPGLGQTLSLTGDTLAISGGNSVDVANATTVSTSKVKLTAQTYIAGFNTTNFTGDVRSEGRVISAPPLGNGTATLNGSLANVTITGSGGNNPSVLFQKSVSSASIVYNGADLLMSTIKVSTIATRQIYDSFGSAGVAGQQLQSSGAGTGVVWGAGSGTGLTAVIAGDNIGVDNTNPIAPVVSVSIVQDLDMNGFNIIDGNDIQLKGANPSVDFKNSAGVDKAFLNYAEFNDQISLTSVAGAVAAEAVAFGGRMILNGAGSQLSSTDRQTILQRSETGVGIKTIMTLEDNGLVQIGAAGIAGNPTLTLQSGSDPTEFISMSYNASTSKGIIQTGQNGQLDILSDSSMLINSGGAVAIQAPSDSITLASNDATILMNSAITATALDSATITSGNGNFVKLISGSATVEAVSDIAGSGSASIAAGAASVTVDDTGSVVTVAGSSILLGGLTTYDTAAGVQTTVNAGVDVLDQVLTNNAYVPMTAWAELAGFTINSAPTVAFDTNSMPGGQLFKWRYSGQLGPNGGLNSESRYCAALRFQVDVNIASRIWTVTGQPETIIWWVELVDITNAQSYEARDFGNSGDRYGYLTTSQINPTNSEICHSVSFSSIFDLDTGVTSLPVPDDGDDCYFNVYGWSSTSISCDRAHVSVSIRPMRSLV